MNNEERYLMYHFGENIENFFSWITKVLEVKKESDTYVLLSTLIETESDLQDYIDNYYDGNFDDLWSSAMTMQQDKEGKCA